MKKSSLRILLAIYCSLFLLAGNLSYNPWSDICRTIDGMNSECEMECCKTDCCTENTKGVVITSKKECCEIQPSNETEQPYQPITVNKNPDKPQSVTLSLHFSSGKTIQSNTLDSSPPGKISPAYLEYQNLRI